MGAGYALKSAMKTVNLGKIGKRLRREAIANPKKAAFLGLATLVALYFWAPLVWGWIARSDQSAATAKIAVPMAAVPSPVTVPSQPAAKKASWPQIVQWMHDDARTMTTPPLMLARDPFEASTTEMAEATAVELPKSKPQAITPTAAGLALTSTIVGPQRRIAQINGKTYSVGQSVEVAKDKEALAAAFRLIEVHTRRVVLEADGQRYELEIPAPGKSGRIELSGGR